MSYARTDGLRELFGVDGQALSENYKFETLKRWIDNPSIVKLTSFCECRG